MDIINYILLFIGDIILSTFSVYCWNKLLKNEKSLFNKKNYILIAIAALIVNLSSYIFQNPLRIIVVSFMLVLVTNNLTNKDIHKSITLVFISQIILGLSEFSFLIIFTTIFNNDWVEHLTETYMFSLLNIYVAIVSILIMKTNIPSRIYRLFVPTEYKSKNKESMINIFIIITVMIIATTESYQNVPITIVLITNVIVVIISIAIVIKSTITNNNYNNISNKYQTSINSLKEYETMIDKFRVNTHENKNELLTIRSMIKSNDKKVVEYIDKLVDNKIKDNEKIMYQTSKIPEGGLRATIYSKLCIMDKNKINYKLDISKDVRTVDLINIDEELILNICKILGVFIDNSIDAVKNLKKKEIEIELYVIADELYIDITNNFKGKINLSKIGHERHTTKGKEHGYGLLLVNKIIKENSRYLENEKKISGNYFTQSLIIKIK